MVIALLAVLKSGAAYLPLDPDYPAARLAFMLTDSGASLLITQSGVIQEAVNTHRLDASQTSNAALTVLELDNINTQATLTSLDQAPVTQTERLVPLTPQNLAYLIYTSGSTGTPKGAGNTQSALINRLDWMQSKLQLTSVDRVLQKTPWSFDVSVWEFLLPLFNGATLIVAKPEGHKDPRYLEQLILEQQITTLHFVPSMLDAFLASGIDHALLNIRHLVTSGEALSGSLQFECLTKLPHTLLWNFYGPTEAAIDVTYWECRKSDEAETPPIGYPIQNTQIYILDASLNPLPFGVAGELYIAGAGLARGYLGRGGLTAERFIANPFTPGARMYRSGDLARWTENGVLEYLGRADAQVKIRGFRIELGEIEAALVAIPGIAQCTVQARGEDGAKQLVAYLVKGVGVGADTTIPEASTFKAVLSTTLPDYMVPAAFLVLESLPLTPNGKLDVRALPAPEITGEGEYRAPVTEHERLIAALFAELTGAKRVGLGDSFFALGGHSLLAMRLLSQLRARTGTQLALRTLFEYPTVEEFASQFNELPTRRKYQPLLPLNKTGSLTPLFCFPPAGGISTVYKNLSDELGAEHPLWGLQARGVDDDEDKTDQTISEAASTYVKAIKEVQPQGPYYLMGHSLGGTLAHEAAVQLEESGDSVAALFLLDTVVSYQQPESDSRSENEVISELMISMLKETTDQDLPLAFDDMLNLFQNKLEELEMIPVGTPKSYVLSALKNSVQSSRLTRNHKLKKCHANIVLFRATQFSDKDTPSDELFNWQPFTDKTVHRHEIAVTHTQMLWKPVSYKLIAKVVNETMRTNAGLTPD
jgi:amino acid adenylation domain-containing protein